MNDEGYQQLLEQLRTEHRDLDDAIEALMDKNDRRPTCRLRDLKKEEAVT